MRRSACSHQLSCAREFTGVSSRAHGALARREIFCRRACKPNSVEDGHSSRCGIAASTHQRPTRRFPHLPSRSRTGEPALARRAGTHPQAYGQPADSLPIWSCSVWGLPCLRALQPERCALTAPFHPYRIACALRRYLLCGTSRLCALTRKSRTLSGTLPCGVRTFLPQATQTRAWQRPSSPPACTYANPLRHCRSGVEQRTVELRQQVFGIAVHLFAAGFA